MQTDGVIEVRTVAGLPDAVILKADTIDGVQNELQTAKATILAKGRQILGSGLAVVTFQLESDTDRLDIITELLMLVICHNQLLCVSFPDKGNRNMAHHLKSAKFPLDLTHLRF